MTKEHDRLTKEVWCLTSPFLELPSSNTREGHTQYINAQRKVAKLVNDPAFVEGVRQCQVTFIEFLLKYDVGLTPRAREFLNRDMASFLRPRDRRR